MRGDCGWRALEYMPPFLPCSRASGISGSTQALGKCLLGPCPAYLHLWVSPSAFESIGCQAFCRDLQ